MPSFSVLGTWRVSYGDLAFRRHETYPAPPAWVSKMDARGSLRKGSECCGEIASCASTRVPFSDSVLAAFLGTVAHYFDETLRDDLSRGSSRGPFSGTSNTYEAMATGLEPIGTSAHELPMILAGMLDDGSDDPQWLRRAQRQVIDDWWELYGSGLSIFLPDTWGTDFFFSVLKDEDLRQWNGFRWDSGDLWTSVNASSARRGIWINPEDKMLVASDALDLEAILEASDTSSGRIRMTLRVGHGVSRTISWTVSD